MSDIYRRSWSDAAHYARRLIRANGICSAIRYLFADDVTYSLKDTTACITRLNIVKLSVKRCLIAEQTVSLYISCFHTFMIVCMVEIAQGAMKMLMSGKYRRP